MPPRVGNLAWLPSFQATNAGVTGSAVGAVAGVLGGSGAGVGPVTVAPADTECSVTVAPADTECSAVGMVVGEGLLPLPSKLTKKILNLEFVEMRDLMPETWMTEEEEGRNVLALPKRRSPPITDVLQWLQCFSRMVGVLSRGYPNMVPELMGYQALIIKCSRDFEGLVWAQYDRAYRRQAAQSRDLQWSKLNPTLYSLCFAGKARRNVACCHCLSDMHTSEACLENPTRALLSWSMPSFVPGTSLPPQPSWAMNSYQTPRQSLPSGGAGGGKFRVCHLFNARDGFRCAYNPCKFAHVCLSCRGNHPKSACANASAGAKSKEGPSAKRPRED